MRKPNVCRSRVDPQTEQSMLSFKLIVDTRIIHGLDAYTRRAHVQTHEYVLEETQMRLITIGCVLLFSPLICRLQPGKVEHVLFVVVVVAHKNSKNYLAVTLSLL